jgi:methionyl-tRNA formyltransferase
MGTAGIACPLLGALAESPAFQLLAAVSQPDKPRGRDLQLQPTPVKTAALALGLPVLQPARARDEAFLAQLRALAPDVIVVLAYGQLLPQSLLDIPRLGCLNIHTSLLPRWRGAAPIQWALLEGDTQTGVTLMKMDAGLDTGPIVATRTTLIRSDDNAQSLHDRLASIGAELAVQEIPRYAAGELPPRPQPADGVTLACKITKDDGRLDWSLPARALLNRIRAFNPWPSAYTFIAAQSKPRLLKIWRAELVTASPGEPGLVLRADRSELITACGQDALRLLEVQAEGGRRMSAQEFLAGHLLAPGSRLGAA